MVRFFRQVRRRDDATLALQSGLTQRAGRLLHTQWVHLEPRVSFCRLRDDSALARGLLSAAIVGVKFTRALFAWGVCNWIAWALLHLIKTPNRFWDLLHVQSGDVHFQFKRCCLTYINDCSVGLVRNCWAGAEVMLMILSLINEFNNISTFDYSFS